MAEIRTRLGKPPIAEALIDIRIVGAEPPQEMLKSLSDSLKSAFPKIDERRIFQATVVAGAEGQVESADRGFFGYFLQSADAKTTVQLKKSGFTLNRLAPYIGGDRLVDEALGLWDRYAATVKPDGVSRLAIRYINRIDLPLKEGDQLDRRATWKSRNTSHNCSPKKLLVCRGRSRASTQSAISRERQLKRRSGEKKAALVRGDVAELERLSRRRRPKRR